MPTHAFLGFYEAFLDMVKRITSNKRQIFHYSGFWCLCPKEACYGQQMVPLYFSHAVVQANEPKLYCLWGILHKRLLEPHPGKKTKQNILVKM